jgi:RNA polymerase sigma factor (sigma-70 family)
MLKRFDPDEEWREECELAFAWQHRRNHEALHQLVERFQPLLECMAAERFRKAQLDAQHYEELLQAGQVGLLEAANRYDGRNRFATYARHWIFKRMTEYVRWNWNVVLMPEPAKWKVVKEDQIPPTIPNDNLSPFENPYSFDKKGKRGRHITISTPREDDKDNRAPEEWVVGRLHAGTVDMENRLFGDGYFEPSEYQFRAHENMEAWARAIEVETLSAERDARHACLTRRKFQIIRARFPWACDVKNCPDREDDNGFPRKHTRGTIGDALGISDEWVRRLEDDALEEMGRREDRFEFLVERLVECLAEVMKRKKRRWLKPSFLHDEEIVKRNSRPKADYLSDKRVYLARKRQKRAFVLQR